MSKVRSKFRDAEQNTRHKLLRYLTFWKHLICISVLCSQMVRLPREKWCHVCLPQSLNEFNMTHRISGCNEHKPNLYTSCLLSVLLPSNWCVLHSYPISSSIKCVCKILHLDDARFESRQGHRYTEYFSWTFSVPHQANSGTVPTMRPCLLPSTSFTIHFHHTFIWGLYCASSVAYTVNFRRCEISKYSQVDAA